MENKTYKIGLIGTGNIAWHLGRYFENAGHTITDIYSRNADVASTFAKDFYNASSSDSLDFSSSKAEVFILAVSDNAIQPLSQEIQLPEHSVLAHTSGAVSLDHLGYAHTPNTGVFYPLQTFSKGKKVDIDHVPICIEGSSDLASSTLTSLAKSVSSNVQTVTSQKRRSIHLAAVFACNFSNHMFTVSKEIMNAQNVDFKLIQPLIAETLSKSLEIGPENSQTGPAKRNDLETLDQQYAALSNDPDTAELYRLISQHIIDYYSD